MPTTAFFVAVVAAIVVIVAAPPLWHAAPVCTDELRWGTCVLGWEQTQRDLQTILLHDLLHDQAHVKHIMLDVQ